MLPADFPAVVRDGVDALRWAAATLGRALPRVPEWVAELAPSTEKSIADAREIAKREGLPLVVSYLDASGWTSEFTDQRHYLLELAIRLERRTDDEWASGAAATYFSGLDITLLQRWRNGADGTLFQWLGEGAEKMRQRKTEFAALALWLDEYLDMNA
jgi:hypothetical protein